MQASSDSQVASVTMGSSPGHNLDLQQWVDPIPTHTAESQRLSDLLVFLNPEV